MGSFVHSDGRRDVSLTAGGPNAGSAASEAVERVPPAAASLTSPVAYEGIVTGNHAMTDIFREIEAYRNSVAPILITGETGSLSRCGAGREGLRGDDRGRDPLPRRDRRSQQGFTDRAPRAHREQGVYPLDPKTLMRADVHIIAATNSDMDAKLRDGPVREDLGRGFGLRAAPTGPSHSPRTSFSSPAGSSRPTSPRLCGLYM